MTDSDNASGLFSEEPAPDFATQAGYSDDVDDGHAEESQAATSSDEAGTPAELDPTPSDEFVPTYLNDDLQAILRDSPDLTVREFFGANQKELERHWLREDTWTKRRMAEKEEIRKMQEPAQRWERMMTGLDQAQQRAILDIVDGVAAPSQPDPAPSGIELPEGHEDWSVQELVQHLGSQIPGMVEQRAQQIVDARLGQVQEQQAAPVRHAQSLAAAADEWAEGKGLSGDDAMPYINALVNEFGLEKLSASTLPKQLEREYRLAQATSRLQQFEAAQKDTARKTSQARAASPRGGVGASAPTRPSPKRKPTGSFAHAGGDLDDAFARMAEARGMSEAELDQLGK